MREGLCMKKKLALLLSFALCLSLLAGCGQQTAGEDASDLQNEYTPNLLTGEKQAADRRGTGRTMDKKDVREFFDGLAPDWSSRRVA